MTHHVYLFLVFPMGWRLRESTDVFSESTSFSTRASKQCLVQSSALPDWMILLDSAQLVIKSIHALLEWAEVH